MKGPLVPQGMSWAGLDRRHPRRQFSSGQPAVDDWLHIKAWQNQQKHLSVTKVLLTADGAIAGCYSLATGQVDFNDLPTEFAKSLPRRALPVAILAWLGVASELQGQGLGRLLLAQSLVDCYAAGQTFAFVAVILDCVDDAAKSFYRRFDFAELPGRPYRLFLSAAMLKAMLTE